MHTKGSVSRRPLRVVAACAVLSTVALLPVSSQPIGPSVSFMPAMLTVVACFDVLSVYLLVGEFQDRQDPRLLMMVAAYSWSLVVMVAYALAFPGALAVDPLLAPTPSVGPYLYVLWHVGFPVLLGVAWAPWPARWTSHTVASGRLRAPLGFIFGGLLGGMVVVTIAEALVHRLPAIITGVNTSSITAVTAPVAIPLVITAVAYTLHGTWRSAGAERWATVAVVVCLCDLTLFYISGNRYSLGWYWGRSLTMLSAGVVLFAMLARLLVLKTQAEHDAMIDPLTGLSNRRAVFAALDQMIARCHRSGASLGALSLDLDLFKQVNDRYGHEIGDTVLTEVGRVLRQSCRRGDVAARVGGEEFLILLPDTGTAGALVVAEKIRTLVAALTVPEMMNPITVSLGVASLHDGDVGPQAILRRVDRALYQAKREGRNRVVVAPRPQDAELSLQDAELSLQDA